MSTSSTNTFTKFAPVFKVDEEKRLVYGVMVDEVVDNSGEVFDYATSKPYFEEWTQHYQDTTGGVSHGNLRAMHQPISAGKLTSVEFDDENRCIRICAKVVDDAEWEKVLEGVYTGFSIGGKYIKRWKDSAGLMRYTASPVEVSLVDAPCVPTATFQIVKADGTVIEHAFANHEGTDMNNNEVAARARALAKAAGNEADWPSYIEQAGQESGSQGSQPGESGVSTVEKGAGAEQQGGSEVSAAAPAPTEEVAKTDGDAPVVEVKTEAADDAAKADAPGVSQVWKTSDGQTFERKADARAHEATLAKASTPDDPLSAALASLRSAVDSAASGDAAAVKKGVGVISTLGADALKKGMWTISRMASLICELDWLREDMTWERDIEGDGSTLPEQLYAAIATLCDLLKQVVEEETNELLGIASDVVADADVAGDAAKDDVEMVARFVSAPAAERLGKVAAAVAAKVAPAPTTLETVDLVKYEDLRTTNERLQKAVTAAVGEIQELTKRVAQIEKMPAAGGPAKTVVVGKEQDGGRASTTQAAPLTPLGKAELAQQIAEMTPSDRDQLANEVFKSVHAGGGMRFAERTN